MADREKKKKKPPDWQDFGRMMTLLFRNSTGSLMIKNKVGKAANGFSWLVLHPKPKSFEMENGLRRKTTSRTSMKKKRLPF